MSIGDRWGTYETPCPKCGQKTVDYWYYAPDCRGNDASAGIQCKSCNTAFTPAQWSEIEEKAKAEQSKITEMEPKRRARAKRIITEMKTWTHKERQGFLALWTNSYCPTCGGQLTNIPEKGPVCYHCPQVPEKGGAVSRSNKNRQRN